MSTEAQHADSEVEDGEVEATEPDKVSTGALGTLVAVGLFAMISIAAAVTALVRHDIEEEQATKDADSNQVVIALKNQQRGVLNGPAGYVDRAKGLVSLPIDVAKALVVSELARDPDSATPPAPKGAPSAAVPVDTAAAPTGDDAKKPAETGKSEGDKKGAGSKPETVKEHGTMPGKPSAPLTPTAASPGAKAPGPLKN
jgi:hypothetical protein